MTPARRLGLTAEQYEAQCAERRWIYAALSRHAALHGRWIVVSL